MRINWNFRNDPSEDFSDKPVFRPKSSWKPPPSHPGLKLFLSQIEKDFERSRILWGGLGDDRSIVIKKADRGSCVVVWYRDDYIKEAENQLKDNIVYKDVNFKETVLSDLVDKNNTFFKKLHSRKCITEKELQHFSCKVKNITKLGKLYLLSKNHKRFSNVPGRHVISNCGTPTEKASEFLHFCLKPLMQNGWSYIRDSGDFIDKTKKIVKIHEGSFLVTADVVGLNPAYHTMKLFRR